MKKQFRIAAILAACAVLSSCGTYRDGSYPDAPGAAPQAESTTSTAQTEMNSTEADAPPKSREELGLPASAVWNPTLQEWYDSDYMTWDAEKQAYSYLDNAARIEKQKAEGRYHESPIYECEPFSGEIPAEWKQAAAQFYEAEQKEISEDPNAHLSSYLHIGQYGQKEYQALVACSVPYFETCEKLSVTQNDYSYIAMMVVHDILDMKVISANGNPGEFLVRANSQYAAATEAVQAEGDALTAESVSKLQEDYGFMIAPALRDLGKLDLMQIPADAPCRDAEQLAAFADYFK